MPKYRVFKLENDNVIIVEIFNDVDRCEVYNFFYELGYTLFKILDRNHTKMWKVKQ